MDKNSEEQLTLPIVETLSLNTLWSLFKKTRPQCDGNKESSCCQSLSSYVAWELQLPLLPTPIEVIRQKKDHMGKLLQTPDGSIPHTDDLATDWLDEEQSMAIWPPTMIQDIAVYLDSHSPSRTWFTKRL